MNRNEIAPGSVKVISKKAIANMEAEEKISTGNAEQNTDVRVSNLSAQANTRASVFCSALPVPVAPHSPQPP